MKSYLISDNSKTINFELTEIEIPKIAQNELLIRVRAAGMNRGELLKQYKFGGAKGDREAAGIECAGEVVAIGRDVDGISIGDRVMGRSRGAYAEYSVMEDCDVLHVPDNLTWVQAAAIPIAYAVAYDVIMINGRLKLGDSILIVGISSGVGVACLQLARALGAKIVGTSRSAEKLDALSDLGLDIGICAPFGVFHEEVLVATDGNGADLVVNVVGGSVLSECVKSMGFGGKYGMVGYVDGVLISELDLGDLHSKRLTLFGASARKMSSDSRFSIKHGLENDVLPLFANDRLSPLIAKVFKFDDINRARLLMQQNEHLGKIVIDGFE